MIDRNNCVHQRGRRHKRHGGPLGREPEDAFNGVFSEIPTLANLPVVAGFRFWDPSRPFLLRWVMTRFSLRFRQTPVTANSTAPKSPEAFTYSTATALRVRQFPSRARSRSWESRWWR